MLCYHPASVDQRLIMPKIFAVLLVFTLSACGYRGPLMLPPGPAPEPLLGTPKPAKPAVTKPIVSDVSTTQKAPSL
jgi:predicted small lipoprotein YifL